MILYNVIYIFRCVGLVLHIKVGYLGQSSFIGSLLGRSLVQFCQVSEVGHLFSRLLDVAKERFFFGYLVNNDYLHLVFISILFIT